MKKLLLFFYIALMAVCPRLSSLPVEEKSYPVIILGGGVGALTAATYLSRAGIQPVVITGPVVGGTITQSTNIQNWPGELTISGDVLSDKLYKQAEASGASLLAEDVVSVDFSQKPYLITTKKLFSGDLKTYKAEACIIALGATPNLLNVPGEAKYWAHGVYSCAVCDGALYKDKTVAVVGGGDSALVEVQYLSNIAKKVYLIVRGDQMRTVEKRRAEEILSKPNVEVLYKTKIQEIKGKEDHITHLLLQDQSSKTGAQIAVDALFLAIGSHPNTELFQKQLELDEKNYIILKRDQQTSLDGVFAIGDISDPKFKQAITAAGDGAKAALQAQEYLSSTVSHKKKQLRPQTVATIEQKEVIEIRSRPHFEAIIKQAHGPVFVDFYSTRCGPCRTFSPIYESWAKEYSGPILFLKANADIVPELFDKYRIGAVPTLAIFNNQGSIVRKSAGSEIGKIEKCLQEIKGQDEVDPNHFRY
jgi:thioredoxin reductase (NADPH)